ncbi:MAG: TonB-dependent receptor [Gammaproteobacteria bacterium]|nr:TonB-dependent receptor [Gammaproteobacteria bacterium]
MNRNPFFLLAMVPWLGPVAFAEEAASGEEQSETIEEIIVLGHPLSGEGLAQATDVISGEELDRKAADSIGATVGNEAGIHNSSFGVAVGRPVIHGLDGARVRIMEDRIDTLDVSVTSGDHAVTVDPFIANQIEILKGSGTLLYGSGAIGGVVDVHTGRIPHNALNRVGGRFDLKRGDNGDGTNGSFRMDGGVGMLGWHLDGFSRRAGDFEIPGFAASARELAREEEEEEEEHHDEEEEEEEEEEGHHEEEEEEEFFGVLPGSGFEVRGGSAGISLVDNGEFILGVSVSRITAEYGIPGHGHEEHGHHEDGEEEHEEGEEEEEDHAEDEEEEGHGEEGTPIADLDQTRVDFEAAVANPLPGFSSLNLRFGVNRYAHNEVEPSGEIGSAFENDAWEARGEMSHYVVAGWEGVAGAQMGDRRFSVVGEEAFTPPVDTRTFGVFWVGERSFPGFQLESGIRFDSVEHDPAEGASKSFGGVSASLGMVIPIDGDWTGTLLADYSTRAPVGEELYSNGPHFATRSFEIGDAGLGEESALNLSGTLTRRGDGWTVLGTVYRTSFSDFIFQATTGEYMEGLAVRQFNQANATFSGLDLEASVEVAAWDGGQLEFSGLFDTVSAKVDVPGNDNLPRIPPARVGVGMAYTGGPISVHLDYMRVFSQDEAAELEFETDGYNDLRAYVGWDVEMGDMSVSLYLQGRNLTDDEQRKHTSVVKDLVPEPGRTVEAGVRIRY